MAKSSAKSKGYRKSVKKKPFLTKKEIIELIVIVGVVALGVVLFTLLYDDGYLGARDVMQGDIVSFASKDQRTRYAKVGTVGEIDGFTRKDNGSETSKVATYSFTPDEPVDDVDYIRISGSYIPAEQIADNTIAQLSALSSDGSTVIGEKRKLEIQGRTAYSYSYTNSYYDPAYDPEVEDATQLTSEEYLAKDKNVYAQGISCYIEADENHTLCYSIYLRGEDDSYYLNDEQISDLIDKYSGAFTVVPLEEAN